VKKYVCPIKYYPNCRKHNLGYYSTTEFFDNKEQLMDYALKYIDAFAILAIYTTEGHKAGDVEYDLGSHCCNGIKVRIEGNTYLTRDDGKGKLIWSEL